jgi:hypothetical protein
VENIGSGMKGVVMAMRYPHKSAVVDRIGAFSVLSKYKAQNVPLIEVCSFFSILSDKVAI